MDGDEHCQAAGTPGDAPASSYSLGKGEEMSEDSLPSKPAPHTLRAPRLFDSQPTTLSSFSPSALLPVQSQQVSEAWDSGCWPAQEAAAAAASPAPTFAAESADGACLACAWRRAPAGSRVPHPHPSAHSCASPPLLGLAPIHQPPRQHSGCCTSPLSGKVTFGQQRFVKATGGSGIPKTLCLPKGYQV